jgi:hypothetical protein
VKCVVRQAPGGAAEHGCTRRAFLLAVLAGVTGGATLTNRYSLAAASPEVCGPPAWLAGITGRRDAVVRLGQTYLKTRPAEQDSDVLAAAIDRALASELAADARAAADPLQVIAALRRVVRAEYARGEVVRVAGWVLSTTEARLYGLQAALSDRRPGIVPDAR